MFYSFVLSANQTNCEGKKNVFTRQNRLSNDLPEFFSLGMEKYQNFFKVNLS